MSSFLAGIGCAVILAAGTLWVLEAGTIAMAERSDDLSTLVQGTWSERAEPSPNPEDTQ